MLNFVTVEEINRQAENKLDFIKNADAEYSLMVHNAAKAILKNIDQKPVVLLSGPSGSGKTTTSLRIEALLRSWGHGTHTLSMDNYYYRPLGGTLPTDDEGELDLESPDLVDGELLRRHVKLLIDGETVEVPSFDFINQRRSDEYAPIKRRPGEIIIIEGIHALNPAVVGDAHGWGTGVYVSVRTRVKDANGFVLHPAKIRLLRRMIRDLRGRGQSHRDTVRRLRSVNRGERLYILPNKGHADISLDTFCPYELPVYRQLLLDGLAGMEPEFIEDCEVTELAPMLRQIAGMDATDEISREALIREFIGGGLA